MHMYSTLLYLTWSFTRYIISPPSAFEDIGFLSNHFPFLFKSLLDFKLSLLLLVNPLLDTEARSLGPREEKIKSPSSSESPRSAISV